MFLHDLFERRSNPERNPRAGTPLEQLMKFRGEDDVFVSFTQGFGKNKAPKLGINPRSGFDTPLGVYCYPVDYVIDYTEQHGEDGRDHNGGLEVPFSGDSPWDHAWVFRVTAPLERELTGDLTMGEWREKMRTLESLKLIETERLDAISHEGSETAYAQTAVAWLWNTTRLLSIALKPGKASIGMWTSILRKLDFDLAYDARGDGFIHDNEPTQAVIFNPGVIRPLTIINRSVGHERVQNTWKSSMVKLISTGAIDRIPAARVQRLTITNVDDTIRFIGAYAEPGMQSKMKWAFLDKCSDEQKSQVAFFCISNHDFDIIDYILRDKDFPDRQSHITRICKFRALRDFLINDSKEQLDKTTMQAIWATGKTREDIAALLAQSSRIENFEDFKQLPVVADVIAHGVDG